MSENQDRPSSASDHPPPAAEESAQQNPGSAQSDHPMVEPDEGQQPAQTQSDRQPSDRPPSERLDQPSGSPATGDEVRIRVDAGVSGPPRRPSDDLHLPPGDLHVASDAPRKSPLVPGALRGMQRDDHHGRGIIDALAGRASVLGFGSEQVVDAIQVAAEQYLGDASFGGVQQFPMDPLPDQIREILGDQSGVRTEVMQLFPSSDQAVDQAIGLARKSGNESAFRTISFIGSDHGRTGMCRTASGQPELSHGFGPMMAGFTHVPYGDIDAVSAAIDDQTTSILLSPIELSRSAQAADADFLLGLRELCDQHNVLLIFDETQIVFGATGKPFTFASIADVEADMVIVAAGLFGGLPGGLIIGSEQAIGGRGEASGMLPLQSAVAAATMAEMIRRDLPASADESMHEFALEVAQTLGGFPFVRDLHVTGMTLGIQTDIACTELIEACDREGLRVESAGETSVRLQPPLVIGDDDRRHLLEMMTLAMKAVERATQSLGV